MTSFHLSRAGHCVAMLLAAAACDRPRPRPPTPPAASIDRPASVVAELEWNGGQTTMDEMMFAVGSAPFVRLAPRRPSELFARFSGLEASQVQMAPGARVAGVVVRDGDSIEYAFGALGTATTPELRPDSNCRAAEGAFVCASSSATLDLAIHYVATRARARTSEGIPISIEILPAGVTHLRATLEHRVNEIAASMLALAARDRAAHDGTAPLVEPERVVRFVRRIVDANVSRLADVRSLSIVVRPDRGGLIARISGPVEGGSPLARDLTAAQGVVPAELIRLPRSVVAAVLVPSRAVDGFDDLIGVFGDGARSDRSVLAARGALERSTSTTRLIGVTRAPASRQEEITFIAGYRASEPLDPRALHGAMRAPAIGPFIDRLSDCPVPAEDAVTHRPPVTDRIEHDNAVGEESPTVSAWTHRCPGHGISIVASNGSAWIAALGRGEASRESAVAIMRVTSATPVSNDELLRHEPVFEREVLFAGLLDPGLVSSDGDARPVALTVRGTATELEAMLVATHGAAGPLVSLLFQIASGWGDSR